MKNLKNLISVLIVYNFFISSTFAQVTNSVFNKKGQTYALIIGITSYQNQKIPALEFAHKDAKFFAEFLKSDNGGRIPEENIRLLTNEQADIGSVYNGLDWLKNQVKENDQAYFYFSGHGDVETNQDKKLGYLLAYNSPPNNYTNNAISLQDINNDANFISLNKKGKMVLILDACHAGVLAGDFFKGKQFVNKQLQTILNNEVRLTACAENQEAAEGINWGGGRGAFSFYLLKGLNGFAEKNNDTVVVVKELQGYLDSCFVNDQFLKSQNHSQNPVIDGHPEYPLSAGLNNSFAIAKSNELEHTNPKILPLSLSGFSKIETQPIDLLFNWFDSISLERQIDFKSYEHLGLSDFTKTFIDDLKFINSNTYINDLKKQVGANKSFQKRFSERFVEYVHKKGQSMINDYLLGDLGELRKRDYYNFGKEEYVRFLEMLNIAKGLVPEEHHLAHTLDINYNYLAGLIARIQMTTSNNLDSLFIVATSFQNAARKLEPYAAYIQNELGVLALLKKDYDTAENNFKLSAEIAPTWAIPWVNLISVYVAQRNLPKAKLAIQKTEELQPNLEYKEMNSGLLNELEKNWLSAESNYLLAIEKNKEHFFPYERLGFVNINKADFSKAQYYFKEAEKRKQGINEVLFKQGVFLLPLPKRFFKERDFPQCKDLDSLLSTKGKEFQLFYHGFSTSYLHSGGYDSLAAEQLKNGLELNPNMPLAKHVLGKMYYKNGEWQKALELLLVAQNEYLIDPELETKLNSILNIDKSSKVDSCILNFFGFFQYEALEDRYLLAEIYQKLGKPENAIRQYKYMNIIENRRHGTSEPYRYFNFSNLQLLAALKLSLLYENLEQYDLAEKTLKDQILFIKKKYYNFSVLTGEGIFWIENREIYNISLYDFYERMIGKFPRDYQWQEKLGLYIHDFLKWSISIESYISNETSNYIKPRNTIIPTLGMFQSVKLMGTDDYFKFKEVKNTDSIAYYYLNKSIKLNGNQNPNVKVLQALADLAPWVGEFDTAISFHNQVLSLEENQKSRNALIKLYNYKTRFPEALSQLKALNQKNQLNSIQKLQFVQYLMLSNEFKTAVQIINRIDSTDLENLKKNYYLFYNLTGKDIEANLYLKKSLDRKFLNKLESEKQYGLIIQNLNSKYIKARQFALKNNSEKALYWLQKSIDAGFIYYEVLQNDPAWEKFKTKTQWIDLSKIVSKMAFEDANKQG